MHSLTASDAAGAAQVVCVSEAACLPARSRAPARERECEELVYFSGEVRRER